MSSSDSFKFLVLFVLCFSACGWRAAKPADAPASASIAEELKSGVPFSAKEPENFQADFIITANGAETKIFVARAGNRRRYDYDAEGKNPMTILRTGAGAEILIFPRDKIYALNAAPQNEAPAEGAPDFLTNELLSQKPDAKFSRLGAENDLTKYAVRFNDSDKTETIVFVDEAVGLPVRQEFYSVRGEQKVLAYTVEMKNFKTQADENLFETPKDFRKVSIETLRAAMRGAKSDGE